MKYRVQLIFITLIILLANCRAKIIDGKEVHKYPNGNIQFEYTYTKGVLKGPYKAYYENGNLWSEGGYDNGNLDGPFKTYTLEGKLATEDIYKSGTLIHQKIYWQPIPYEGGFLFVSDDGYVRIKDGQYINSDSLTPDNIIEEQLNPKIGSIELYVWKKGQKTLYKIISKPN